MAERRKGIGGRRFHINLEDKTWKVSHKSCDFCGGEVESVPMLDNVCYSCYQVLVRNPENVTAYKLHKACTLGSAMRDCDNCKFQPRPIRTSSEVEGTVTDLIASLHDAGFCEDGRM